nr:hypothetical protein VW1_00020 [Enterobacter sp.]
MARVPGLVAGHRKLFQQPRYQFAGLHGQHSQASGTGNIVIMTLTEMAFTSLKPV